MLILAPAAEAIPWSADPQKLATLVPASVILFTSLYDLAHACRLPNFLSRTVRWAYSPFQDFLDLEELDEPDSPYARPPPPRWKIRLLTLLPIFQSCLHVTISANRYFRTEKQEHYLYTFIAVVAWLYTSLRTLFKPPTTPPYLLLIFFSLNALHASVDVLSMAWASDVDKCHEFLNLSLFTISTLLVYTIGTFPINDILPGQSVASGNATPSSSETNPEDGVSLWEWCTFSFVEPIFPLASSRRLEPSDVWTLSPFFKQKNLLHKYLGYRERYPGRSLIRFLVVSHSLDLCINTITELACALSAFIPVYALQQILFALEDGESQWTASGYLFALAAFVSNLFGAQLRLFQLWHAKRAYERTRGLLLSILHYKALHRRDTGGTNGSLEDVTTEAESNGADLGKIVNLMQVDAYALAHQFWMPTPTKVPVLLTQLIIALLFLYRILGWSSLAGLIVVIIANIINIPLAKLNANIIQNSWKAKDKRMNKVNETFQNIRFLKYYGWESHWASQVIGQRERELAWRVKENICAVLISFIWLWVPSGMAFFSFMSLTVISGGTLTVAKTFTSLALFERLQSPMMELPEQIFSLLRAWVSLGRINAFLREEEVPPWASEYKRSVDESMTGTKSEIGFDCASFNWHHDEGQITKCSNFCLGPLDVTFPIGQLSLVTGATGSGKTTLLLALLGEMNHLSGNVHMNKAKHQVAYCAQNPWLEHSAIRENIIFGSRRGFDEERYASVIDACSLKRDLDMFDAGDHTEIGDKGVTLSGGQRARVALARALYSEAACILLDDPLAAVDMHTAQHIVEKCLQGELARDRTIILITHHVSLCLSSASFLVELHGGQIQHQGYIKELQELGLLRKLLESEDTANTAANAGQSDEEVKILDKQADHKKNLNATTPGSTTTSGGKLTEAEHRAEGRVSIQTYLTYAQAAGLTSWGLTFVTMVLVQVIKILSDLFLASWSTAYEDEPKPTLWSVFTFFVQPSFVADSSPVDWLPSPVANATPWLITYLWISLAGTFATIVHISIIYYASLQASRRLFSGLLYRLVRAPARFFDVTPMGRILNRFTADMNTIDSALQQSTRGALSGGLAFLASFLFIVWIVPQFTPFAILIALLYIRIAPRYIRASRDLRRLESVHLSPTFSSFDELLRGLSHIRAFAMERRYQDTFENRVDAFQRFDHSYWLVACWLRWRYMCLGAVVVFATTLSALWSGLPSGFVAVVIVQSAVFAEVSRQLVSVAAQLELDFNSVERIGEYMEAPEEAPLVIDEKQPPAYWPSSSGSLVVEDLTIGYSPELPPVLNGLNFVILPGEKIGVVGRTGSGKSTLALSLLRIVEPTNGKIILDGIDVSTIGLDDLRSRITIVSQDVALFTGTIRSNLDPFGEHTDQECWDVLSRSHLAGQEGDSRTGIVSLDTKISPAGSLSAGERQLIAIARAILRRSQVVIMDEATSQIDVMLDDQIQRTIREELSGAMVITIAHRLKTIIDYDRILVLGGGQVIEFDTPHNLFNRQGGTFRELCRRSADWENLEQALH